MNAEKYIQTQMTILAAAEIFKDLDLEEFVEAINKAEAVGPILDPTLFSQASAPLWQIKQLAEAGKEFQRRARAAYWFLSGRGESFEKAGEMAGAVVRAVDKSGAGDSSFPVSFVGVHIGADMSSGPDVQIEPGSRGSSS